MKVYTYHVLFDRQDPSACFLHVLLSAGDRDDITVTALSREVNLRIGLLTNL